MQNFGSNTPVSGVDQQQMVVAELSAHPESSRVPAASTTDLEDSNDTVAELPGSIVPASDSTADLDRNVRAVDRE